MKSTILLIAVIIFAGAGIYFSFIRKPNIPYNKKKILEGDFMTKSARRNKETKMDTCNTVIALGYTKEPLKFIQSGNTIAIGRTTKKRYGLVLECKKCENYGYDRRF